MICGLIEREEAGRKTDRKLGGSRIGGMLERKGVEVGSERMNGLRNAKEWEW